MWDLLNLSCMALTLLFFFFLKILFIHSWETHTERGRDTEEKQASYRESNVGLHPGTRSWDSRITPWTKGRRQTAEPPRDPQREIFYISNEFPDDADSYFEWSGIGIVLFFIIIEYTNTILKTNDIYKYFLNDTTISWGNSGFFQILLLIDSF